MTGGAYSGTSMRTATVHEWMVSRAGSERVLEAILEVVSDADLYSIADFLPPAERAFLKGRAVRPALIDAFRIWRAERASRSVLTPGSWATYRHRSLRIRVMP